MEEDLSRLLDGCVILTFCTWHAEKKGKGRVAAQKKRGQKRNQHKLCCCWQNRPNSWLGQAQSRREENRKAKQCSHFSIHTYHHAECAPINGLCQEPWHSAQCVLCF